MWTVEEEPRAWPRGAPEEGEALARGPEECKSLCIEHSRDHKENHPEEDIAEGEKEEGLLDGEFRGMAYALSNVQTGLADGAGGGLWRAWRARRQLRVKDGAGMCPRGCCAGSAAIAEPSSTVCGPMQTLVTFIGLT